MFLSHHMHHYTILHTHIYTTHLPPTSIYISLSQYPTFNPSQLTKYTPFTHTTTHTQPLYCNNTPPHISHLNHQHYPTHHISCTHSHTYTHMIIHTQFCAHIHSNTFHHTCLPPPPPHTHTVSFYLFSHSHTHYSNIYLTQYSLTIYNNILSPTHLYTTPTLTQTHTSAQLIITPTYTHMCT